MLTNFRQSFVKIHQKLLELLPFPKDLSFVLTDENVRLSNLKIVSLGNGNVFAYPKCFLIRCSLNRRFLVLQRRNGNWEMKKCSLNRIVLLSGVRLSGVDCISGIAFFTNATRIMVS